uniref:B-cell receptor CD22 n=1 Tax=Oncorhynchus tshawytscha TaxID=74940 RepID=A0A8C8G7A1_ONCTS
MTRGGSLTFFPVVDQCLRCARVFNDVVKLFTKWGVLEEAFNTLVRSVGRFWHEAVILGHIFLTFPCIMQPFLWVTLLSETLIQTVAEKGLCAVISCTFTHPDNIKPTAAVWFKCPTKGKCDEDKIRIVHSNKPSKAQEGYKQRVSLLETDLTKKNCSVIINDIRENDAGEYQFRLPSSYTYPKKVKITVSALTQKPSVLTPPLTEGEPATLTCTAPGMCSGTPPNITWTWRGTGDNITEEDLTNVTTTHFSMLTFTPTAKHHGTNVTCLVSFNGRITTKKTLTMNVEPKISGCNTVREGDTLNLTCSDDSYPPSSSNITWSKKGTTALERNNSGRATLIISNMTREHAGEYVCTAQHHSRSLMASTVVTVMCEYKQHCSDRLKMACDMLLPLNCLWFISPLMTCCGGQTDPSAGGAEGGRRKRRAPDQWSHREIYHRGRTK